MPNRFSYSILEKELSVTENVSGNSIWHGKPKQLDGKIIVPIPDFDDCIVLLDFYQADASQTKNLLRIDPYGRIIWESGFPSKQLYGIKRTDHEAYVFMEYENQKLWGTSWSGFRDEINIDNGAIIDSIFVK